MGMEGRERGYGEECRTWCMENMAAGPAGFKDEEDHRQDDAMAGDEERGDAMADEAAMVHHSRGSSLRVVSAYHRLTLPKRGEPLMFHPLTWQQPIIFTRPLPTVSR